MFNETDAVYICGKCTEKDGWRRTHNRYTAKGKEHFVFAVFRKPDQIQNNPKEQQEEGKTIVFSRFASKHVVQFQSSKDQKAKQP